MGARSLPVDCAETKSAARPVLRTEERAGSSPLPTPTCRRIPLGNFGSANSGGRLIHRSLPAGVFARACVERRVVGTQPRARQVLEEIALAAFLDRAATRDIAACADQAGAEHLCACSARWSVVDRRVDLAELRNHKRALVRSSSGTGEHDGEKKGNGSHPGMLIQSRRPGNRRPRPHTTAERGIEGQGEQPGATTRNLRAQCPWVFTADLSPRGAFVARVAPAQRRREDDVNVGSNEVSRACAELNRVDPPAQDCKFVNCLRAMVVLREHARAEPVRLAVRKRAEANVLRPHSDSNVLAAPDTGREPHA